MMRGSDEQTESLSSHLSLEALVAGNQPLRAIRPLVNAALTRLPPQLNRLYAASGRSSNAPEKLLPNLLMRASCGVRSERQLMEQVAVTRSRRLGRGRLPVAWRTLALAMALAAGLPLASAMAEILRVGPAERLRLPSEAARIAAPGDTIRIAPGTYTDCATWRAADIAIEAAAGGEVVITGPVCDRKGLFVTEAPGITIRGLTFRGAASIDGNGAGIRAEGGDLTILASRFEDNQNGILTSQLPGARLLVEDSVFLRNGALVHECAHGIYAGHLAALVVRRSRFEATRVCHHLKSRAELTELTDSVIEDGPGGSSSYLVDIPNGGDLLMRGNRLSKGPNSENRLTAVMIGAEGVTHRTSLLVIEGNSFESLLPRPAFFVVNRTATPAWLSGNSIRGRVRPLLGRGSAG